MFQYPQSCGYPTAVLLPALKYAALGVAALACLGLPVAQAMELDNGDAPASYGIASHIVTDNAPWLGKNPPDADTAVGSAAADADDNDSASDDEDGVFAFPTLVQNTKAYTVNVFASNHSHSDALLVGWVDFNGNGIFEPFESSQAVLPVASNNLKIKLLWNTLRGVSTDYTGVTYARFRVTTDAITSAMSTGVLADGEVEDYTLTVEPDVDGDEIADAEDPDNDNDSIPDVVEGTDSDADNDGITNHLDPDSDGDGIPDLLEAGDDGAQPLDTDADGTPDFLDTDSDNDGTPDSELVTGDVDGDGINGDVEGVIDSDRDGILNPDDLDSDNDGIPDAVETSADSDGDGVPDFLDLDSDNDGLSDLYESGLGLEQVALLDADGNGRIDLDHAVGQNGLADVIETATDSAVVVYTQQDTDQDGIRNAVDTDSDNDGVSDLAETGGADINNDGQHDSLLDSDDDGIPDMADVDVQGGQDIDNDDIVDSADADFVTDIDDSDLDGITDNADPDSDADGIADAVASAATANGDPVDSNQDGIADFLDDQIAIDNGNDNGQTPGNPSPPTGGQSSDNGIVTGLDGFPGCSIRLAGTLPVAVDPVFPLLLLAGCVWLLRRRFG